MTERPQSPAKKRDARADAREGDRIRRQAIREAMRAGWAGIDADELNWLDEAAQAYPGPDATVLALYGVATRLVERLVEVTGADRDEVLRQVLE